MACLHSKSWAVCILVIDDSSLPRSYVSLSYSSSQLLFLTTSSWDDFWLAALGCLVWVQPVPPPHTDTSPPVPRYLWVLSFHLGSSRRRWWRRTHPLRRAYMLRRQYLTHVDGFVSGFHEIVHLIFAKRCLFTAGCVSIFLEEALCGKSSRIDIADIIIRKHLYTIK